VIAGKFRTKNLRRDAPGIALLTLARSDDEIMMRGRD
jgi:hypothetical protein